MKYNKLFELLFNGSDYLHHVEAEGLSDTGYEKELIYINDVVMKEIG